SRAVHVRLHRQRNTSPRPALTGERLPAEAFYSGGSVRGSAFGARDPFDKIGMKVRSMNASNGVSPARILIVDDQEQNIRLLSRILERAGYQNIAATTNSEDTLAIQAQFKPDLVLLDLHMRGKDGFEVLTELLSPDRGGPHLPVIMLTADDTADMKRRALALGAKDFVGKPFDSAEVLLRIRNLLETKFLHQSLQGQNFELEKKVAERTRELEQSQLEVLERLAAAVEFRDDDTGEHTKRVGLVSAM